MGSLFTQRKFFHLSTWLVRVLEGECFCVAGVVIFFWKKKKKKPKKFPSIFFPFFSSLPFPTASFTWESCLIFTFSSLRSQNEPKQVQARAYYCEENQVHAKNFSWLSLTTNLFGSPTHHLALQRQHRNDHFNELLPGGLQKERRERKGKEREEKKKTYKPAFLCSQSASLFLCCTVWPCFDNDTLPIVDEQMSMTWQVART